MRTHATLLLLLAALLPGCMSVGVDLSPSTIPLDEGDYTEIGERTTGTAWGAMLWILPLSEGAVTKRARDRATENGGGDALIDVSLSSTTYFFPLVTVYRTTVRGIPVALVED